jgi:hypothetical protein
MTHGRKFGFDKFYRSKIWMILLNLNESKIEGDPNFRNWSSNI